MKKIAIFDEYLALSRKWYETELYLQWPISRKSYNIWSIERRHFQWSWTTRVRFQGYAILWRWICQKW